MTDTPRPVTRVSVGTAHTSTSVPEPPEPDLFDRLVSTALEGFVEIWEEVTEGRGGLPLAGLRNDARELVVDLVEQMKAATIRQRQELAQRIKTERGHS